MISRITSDWDSCLIIYVHYFLLFMILVFSFFTTSKQSITQNKYFPINLESSGLPLGLVYISAMFSELSISLNFTKPAAIASQTLC